MFAFIIDVTHTQGVKSSLVTDVIAHKIKASYVCLPLTLLGSS
jgi:hypothetical protein